ncbi:MAG TPA: hypothetical protein VGD67_23615 [Pseudonocardiaceae bacterium]
MTMPRALVLLMLLTAGLLAPAPPASAALPGVELVWSPIVAPGSETTRSAVATCPAGKYVVGAFAFTSSAPHDVVITALVPTASSVYAFAREDQDGYAGDWLLTAQAYCADPPPGLTSVSAYSVINSMNKQVSVTCPTGTRLLTAGWDVGSGAGQVYVNQLAPSITGVSATGMEDQDGQAGNWRVNVHAVCADPLPGHVVQSATATASSADKTVLVDCGPGTRRLALGWTLYGVGGGTPAGQVHAQTGSAGTGWMTLAANEDDDGYAGNWSAIARVVCLTA